jgi:uncharacterized protein YjiS (DUF1127 family)
MTALVHNKQSQSFSLLHALSVISSLIQKWIDVAHQRKQLAELDAHMLHDIGINEEFVRKEINKPFWK